MPSGMEKKPKTKTITIELEQGRFPVVIYANRLGVEDVDGHKLVHFGFVMGTDKQERVLSAFACIFERVMLDGHRKSWLDYLTEVTLPAAESKWDWRAPVERLREVPLTNAVALSRSGDHAEIRCFNYSMGDTLAKVNELAANKIIGQSVALVRCPLELQRQLLVALYADLPV